MVEDPVAMRYFGRPKRRRATWTPCLLLPLTLTAFLFQNVTAGYNVTATAFLTQLIRSSGFSDGASKVPDAAVAVLWEATVGNDTDKRQALVDTYPRLLPSAIPAVVNYSIVLRPDLASELAVDAAISVPSASVVIVEYSVSTLNATDAKAVVVAVINSVKDLSQFQGVATPGTIFINTGNKYPALKSFLLEALPAFATESATMSTSIGVGGDLRIPGAMLDVSTHATNGQNISLHKYDCKFVSTGMKSATNCYAVEHAGPFLAPVVLQFAAPSDDSFCMKSSNEIANDWHSIPCSIIGTHAYITSASPAVFVALKPASGLPSQPLEQMIVGEPATLSRNQITYNIIEQVGPILGRSRNEMVFPNTTVAIDHSEGELLGFSLSAAGHVYFSDGHILWRSTTDSVNLSPKPVIAGIVSYEIEGVNFGSSIEELKGIYIRNVLCSRWYHKSPLLIECVSGDRRLVDISMPVRPMDVVVTTSKGNSTRDGDAIRNPQVRVAEGYRLPIVLIIKRTVVKNRPHAIVVDDYVGNDLLRTAEAAALGHLKHMFALNHISNDINGVLHNLRANEKLVLPKDLHRSAESACLAYQDAYFAAEATKYLYWSDTAEQNIRRAKLDGSDMEILSDGNLTRRVLGIALDSPEKHQLFATDANLGSIVIVPTDGVSSEKPIKTLLGGLRDPHGIALDIANRHCYFTELTGKIYRTSMDGANLEPNSQKPMVRKELLVKRPSKVRMDGLTLDLNGPRRNHKIYWAEANTNNILRCNLDGGHIETIAGVDSSLVFPQGIAFSRTSGALYFSEYFGSIQRFSTSNLVVGNEPEKTKVVDASRGAASIVRDEILAFTRVGGEFFFSIKD